MTVRLATCARETVTRRRYATPHEASRVIVTCGCQDCDVQFEERTTFDGKPNFKRARTCCCRDHAIRKRRICENAARRNRRLAMKEAVS